MPEEGDRLTAVAELRDYPFEPFCGDLPGELLGMARTQPVSRVRLPDGRPVWLVVGHDEVCVVLSDARFSRLAPPATGPNAAPDPTGEPNAAPAATGTHAAPAATEPNAEQPAGCPRELNMDGPAHTIVRRVGTRAFTARRTEAYRPRVQQLVDELVDAMSAAGPPADLISALVAPLPLRVICAVLGVPADDRERFYAWLADLNSVTAHGSAERQRSQAELRGYLAEQVVAKRASTGDDLLSVWVSADGEHDLTDAEIVELAMGVLLGGLEINTTSAGLRALFLHPDALARLRAEPERLPAAVEEILRYTTVSSMFRVQTAVADVTLAGIVIRAGEDVMAVPWVANRDSKQFADAHTFDIARNPNPHLAFGFGPHFCLGAALGRMQVELSIGTLLRRFPALAPAIPIDEVPWRHDRVNGGIAEFPVTW